MSHFAYTFLTPDGKQRRGHLTAPNADEAKAKLRTQGLLVTSLKKARARRADQLRGQPLLDFTLSLASLLRAGLPLFQSLTTLADQAQGTKSHPRLQALCDAISEGASLSSALEGHFEPLYCALVTAGEASGTLPQTLEGLATLLKKRQQLRQKLISSLLYPAVVATFCFAVILLLLTVAVPSMAALLEERTVSPFTSAVLAASSLLRSAWWLLPLPLLPLYRMRKKMFPRTRKEAALARFCHTLATLQEGGVQLTDSLKLARAALSDPPLEAAIQRAEQQLISGTPLNSHLRTEPAIPPLLPRMLAVAEETGSLAPTLHQLAELYSSATEKRLTRLTTLAQPLILLVLGAIVGTIMLAVLLPLTDLSAIL